MSLDQHIRHDGLHRIWTGKGTWHGQQPARVLWEMETGRALRKSDVLRNRCDQSGCIAPDCMVVGQRVRTTRAASWGPDVCINGHLYTLGNTAWRGSVRQCIACRRDRNRRYYAKKIGLRKLEKGQ